MWGEQRKTWRYVTHKKKLYRKQMKIQNSKIREGKQLPPLYSEITHSTERAWVFDLDIRPYKAHVEVGKQPESSCRDYAMRLACRLTQGT